MKSLQAWTFATKFLVKNATTKDKAKLGRWTKKELLDMGPTYIKLGQIVSTRGDIYPYEFTRELESLQDSVPVVEYDIDVDMSAFSSFEKVPFKSASIGQVYKATLASDGTQVIVKARRPNIYNTMKQDTDQIKNVVHFLERLGVDTGNGDGYVLEEAIQNLLSETDYVKEVENAKMFKKNFKKIDWVRVPTVYESLCGEDAIVMEYVPSNKITEVTDVGVNKQKICQALISSYVKQTMEHGFFHADPHPGNVGFNGKQLVFYDFGLVVPISTELRQGFMDLLVAILMRDTKKIVEILVKLKIIVPTTTDTSEIETFFEYVLGYMETLDVTNFSANDELLAELARKKPFVVPSSFVYLAKTFSTVEGLCLKLDPEFNYFNYLEPIIKKQVSSSVNIGDMLTTTAEMPSRIKAISTAVLGLEKSKAAMKRSIDKTRRQIRYAQYAVLSAVLSQYFDDKQHVSMIFILITAWFTFQKSR